MSQQKPRSNFMQLLLMMAVVYLGMMLFCNPARNQEQLPVDLAPAYETAVEEKSVDDILKLGPKYVDQLRRSADELPAEEQAATLRRAREIEFQVGRVMMDQAREGRDFNKKIAAYQHFQRIHDAAPESDIGKRARESMLETQAIETDRGPILSAGYRLIDGIVNLFGGDRARGFSYWMAALVLAVFVRALVWPLANKQMRGARRMSLLQPMMKELQAKYQGPDLQQRVMKLYQKYGINPLAGCWPLLVQMPFLLWVFYSMNHYRFEFQKGTFLWINPDTAAMMPGIIAPNLGERDVPLVILYGISMIASTMLSVVDPSSAKQFRIMGLAMAVVFTIMMLFWTFPSAFILYWIGLNILTTVQSIMVARQPIPPLVEIPEHEQKKGFMSSMAPKEGPKGKTAGNGASKPEGKTTVPKQERKTGAPVLHKPKRGKQKRKK